MRIVVAPAGSRGDFQPLLAFAVGLRAAGHDVSVLTSPNFASEVRAFDLPFHAIGFDVEEYIRKTPMGSNLRATYELLKAGREKMIDLIDDAIPLVRGADVFIGGGAQIAGPTVAEATRVPYVYVAYTPQALVSAEHPPFTFPIHGLPRFANRFLWWFSLKLISRVFGGPLDKRRRALGLKPVADWYGHLFPRRNTILAADPELAPVAPDSPLSFPAVGSFHLPDARPLGDEVEKFLRAGPPPVYIGFGSMPDPRASETAAKLISAARAAGVRLLLSRGWAGFAAAAPADQVLSLGPASHGLLFPRVAAVVHHGGAGTTAAATRAGRPQIVVPHVFDQYHWANLVHEAGLGPRPFNKRQLTVERMASALRAAVTDRNHEERAAALGAQVRARDPIAGGIETLKKLLA